MVAEEDTVKAMQNRANAALTTVSVHLGSLGLRLMVEKTLSAVFTNRRWTAEPRVRLEGQALPVGSLLKYLGVTLQNKGTMFSAHLRQATEKAQRVMGALSGLMPKVGDPRECKRRLLVSVVQSVLLYDAPAWASSPRYDPRSVATLVAVQRRAAVRCVCAYRTVSHDAVHVVTRTPPIDLLAVERAQVYDDRRRNVPPVATIRHPEVPEPANDASSDNTSPRDRTMASWARRVLNPL